MKVAHFGGYAPCASGLYESARDFVRADQLAGRASMFVDVGSVDPTGKRNDPQLNAVDDRGAWPLVVYGIEDVRDADVWVFHDSPPMAEWGDVPIVWIMHGRPAASYKLEALSNGTLRSYSHFAEASKHDAVRVMATMIEEHVPYWDNVLPPEKVRLIAHPPVDPDRFSPNGECYTFDDPGKYNVVLADSWREDVDIFHALNAACIAAEKLDGLKVHCFGAVQDGMSAIEPLRARLRDLGALGEWHAREPFLADVYRSADCVLTSHTIPTRVITEALACGTAVVAGADCRYTPWHARASDPVAVAHELVTCLKHNGSPWPASTEFNLTDFAARMGEFYDEVMLCAST